VGSERHAALSTVIGEPCEGRQEKRLAKGARQGGCGARQRAMGFCPPRETARSAIALLAPSRRLTGGYTQVWW
jgi:hypothetical protein